MKTPLRLMHALVVSAALSSGAARAAGVEPVRVRDFDPSIATERVYFAGATASAEDLLAFRERLLDAGARNVNLFIPDNVIVCDLPLSASATIDVPSAVSRAPAARVEAGTFALAGAAWGWIVEAYRNADRGAAGSARVSAPSPAVPFNDVVLTISPERAREVQRGVEKAQAFRGVAPPASAARSVQHNSEFLGGYILANFVFPESDGGFDSNTETWTDEDLIAAKQGAVEAMIAWQGEFPNMDISFTLQFFERIPTAYEPIQHSMGNDALWVLDTLRSMGWGQTNDMLVGAHQFNEDQRVTRHSQWVFTAFIACSRNTEGHRFGGGNADYTAYAYLGGPCLVEPFPAGSDPNGVGERLVYSQIVNHEAGHNFWTLDEYPGAPGVCGSASGYLNYSNGNISMTDPGGNESRCNPLQECIMHTAARKDIFPRPWCWWSLGHLGVIDANDNGKPDIFDSPPIIQFPQEGADTVTTNDYTLRFRAISTAVPSRNPNIAPDERVNYAAPLRQGWIWLGEDTRIPIDPVDGSWDEMVEDCEFHVQLGQVGTSVFVAQVENSVASESEAAVKRVYFVGVSYSRTALTVKPDRIDVTWEIASNPFAAKFNVYRLRPGEDLPGELIASEVEPSGTSGGFTHYRYGDGKVVPGEDYRYYVDGVFSLDYQGETRTYSSKSRIIGQTAMIPLAGGDMISHVAPNPTRGAVTFSVQVPRTYGGPESAPVREATPVDVSIYSVNGQLVRNLRSGGEFGDVLTLHWDGTNQSNDPAPSGVYFVRALAGTARGVRKIVLIR